MGVFANGSCGTYEDVVTYNDPACGYVPPTTPAPTTQAPTTQPPTTTCTPYGTLLSTYCDDVLHNLMGVFANGSCGTFTAIVTADDPNCGYVPPTTQAPCPSYGTLLSTYCNFTTHNLMGVFANGSCGTFEDVITYNDPNCGYIPPTTQAPTTQAPTTQAPTTLPPACRTFEVEGYNADESVNGVYTNCAGFPDSFSFFGGPGIVGSICAQASSVYVTSGNGAAFDVGGC
jgi:hypothetical protein